MSIPKPVIVIVLLALLAGVFVAVAYTLEHREIPVPATTTYRNEAYGIEFKYPAGYLLTEGEHGDAHRGHYAIMLTREEDAQVPENGEGPTGITIDIYQNNIDQQSLLSWLTGTNASNYKLSGGTYEEANVDGEDAFTYHWSGLYEADSTIFRHNGNIFSVTVTYLTSEDANRTVYGEVVSSIDLLDTAPLEEQVAVTTVQGMWAELADYPSDNLPPRRIQTERETDGWYVAFLTEGSGVQGILDAHCYFISDAKEVMKIGDFRAGDVAPPKSLDLSLCQPA